MKHAQICVLVAFVAAISSGSAADWPRWRGPNADGVADGGSLPTKWSQTENVRWSVKLPGWGTSSPVVYGDRLFVTSQVEQDGKKSLLTLCFDRDTGKELWRHDFGLGIDQRTHEKSNLAVNTPAVTEDAVYVAFGNSSTAIKGMIAGFGGAPNLGSSPPGMRHVSKAARRAGRTRNGLFDNRKLVVQITPTRSEKKDIPVFVNELDAVALCEEGLFDVPPVMIPDHQVTHIVTELGIAYLDRCDDADARCRAIAAIAGDTEVGRGFSPAERDALRASGIVKTPEDLGIDPSRATRRMLAAKSIPDLVEMSGGLYDPPASVLGPS